MINDHAIALAVPRQGWLELLAEAKQHQTLHPTLGV
jgi:hypothetical protein